MKQIKKRLAGLPLLKVGDRSYLSYQAVTDAVAAFLFPDLQSDQIDETTYQKILETADSLCRELGYTDVVKLTPPDVQLSDMGLYWTAVSQSDPDPVVIHTGPGRAEMMQDGLLVDTGLSQLGLDEVTHQHFKIPVTASDGVIDLMHQAVASDWPNDYRGVWHDICGMAIAGGKDINPTERLFTVIIRGLGRKRYWQFKVKVQQDNTGDPFLYICLADEPETDDQELFPLGHVVMTPGAAELGVDFRPLLARHAKGDWGSLDDFDTRQNNTAVKEGYRVLSAYEVKTEGGETERIWIITEADRSATTILLPSEY